jgi:hypothetical protein
MICSAPGDSGTPLDRRRYQGSFNRFSRSLFRPEFVAYELEKKYDVDECQQPTLLTCRKVTLRLIVFDMDDDTGAKSLKTSKNKTYLWATCP